MTRRPNITTLVGKHALKAMSRLFLVFSLTNGGIDCFSFYGNDNTMTQLEPLFSTVFHVSDGELDQLEETFLKWYLVKSVHRYAKI